MKASSPSRVARTGVEVGIRNSVVSLVFACSASGGGSPKNYDAARREYEIRPASSSPSSQIISDSGFVFLPLVGSSATIRCVNMEFGMRRAAPNL